MKAKRKGRFDRRPGSARKAHSLKIESRYLDAVGDGAKAFEVRKADRDFRVGDILQLREWNAERQAFGSRSIVCVISYILGGEEAAKFGIVPGYCVLGIKLPANHCWPPND